MPSRSSRPPAKPAPSSRTAPGAAKKPGPKTKARKASGGAGKIAAVKTASSRAVPGKKAPAATTAGRSRATQKPLSSQTASAGRSPPLGPPAAPKAQATRKRPEATSSPSASRTARQTSTALDSADEQATAEATPSGLTFPIEIDPDRIEHTLKKIGEEVSHWAKKGRYTKVRFKFRGKQLLPDLPLAAVVAAEGLTFYWGGILRALLVTVGANAVFGVELVNDSEKKVLAGKEKLLRGDLEEALALFREAADMDRDNPHVHLNIGIALKLRGERVGAREALLKARQLDPTGPTGDEAEKILSTLPSQMTVTSVVQNGPPMNPDRPSGAV